MHSTAPETQNRAVQQTARSLSARTSAWRGQVLTWGVVACVGAALATAVVKLDDALGIFDHRADLNSTYTYAQRTHTHPEWSPVAGRVLEDARLWMPEDARYRVVYGPRFDPAETSDLSHVLMLGFLLPRRPTSSESAEWVFCYGCDSGTLGPRFDVLSAADGGPAFGRISS